MPDLHICLIVWQGNLENPCGRTFHDDKILYQIYFAQFLVLDHIEKFLHANRGKPMRIIFEAAGEYSTFICLCRQT